MFKLNRTSYLYKFEMLIKEESIANANLSESFGTSNFGPSLQKLKPLLFGRKQEVLFV